MPDDEPLDINELTEARRKSLKESVHSVTLEQLKSLGEQMFKYPDHPFYKQYFQFLEENPHGRYHHATTHDKIEIFYCQDANRGLWFLPGGGSGPLQEKGLKIMKEIVEKK